MDGMQRVNVGIVLLLCLFEVSLHAQAEAAKAKAIPVPQGEVDRVLRAVQTLYGPPVEKERLPMIVSPPFRHDFNGDGQDELVLLFNCDGLGDLKIGNIDELRKGRITRGFLMLTRIEGRLSPVFYYFNEYGAALKLARRDGHIGIVSEGGRDGVQTFWSWREGSAAEPTPAWEARFRVSDSQKKGYGPWHVQPRMFANFGQP